MSTEGHVIHRNGTKSCAVGPAELFTGQVRLDQNVQSVERGRTALKMTPEQHRQEMARAGSGLMREASETIARAVQEVERERVALAGYYRAALTQDQQFKWMCWVGGIPLALGLIFSPMICSLQPFGLNSRMAAFMMHDTRWGAGAALMQADNPAAWKEMVDADAP